MAIMKKGAVAFDDVEDSESPELAGPAPTPSEMVETMEEGEAIGEAAAETATLDAGMIGQPVKAGDVVKLEVVSVSDEDGTVTVKYASPKTGGIDKAAAAFNEEP